MVIMSTNLPIVSLGQYALEKIVLSPFPFPSMLLNPKNKFESNMTPLMIASLSLYIALIAAFPIQAVRDVKLNSQQSSATSDQILTRWSRQDIFTLVSVGVAIIGIFIGVLVTSPATARSRYAVEGYDDKMKLDDGFKNDTKTM
ncbi:unnamed protein product [Alternaria alternata]